MVRLSVTGPGTNSLVLSVFPGVDLLGKAFETAGYCVVRGPDLVTGGDIRDFWPPEHVFEGVIGGSPCQDFSRARRVPVTGYGLLMLEEFRRIVVNANPVWWLLENVPTVPDLWIGGWTWERFDLAAWECGGSQRRERHFQAGTRDGTWIICDRPVTGRAVESVTQPAAMASEGKRSRRMPFDLFCSLQGLPEPLLLPGWTVAGRYAAIGNGVPLYMGAVVAKAVTDRRALLLGEKPCECGCDRIVTRRRRLATAACRQRAKRKRDRAQR